MPDLTEQQLRELIEAAEKGVSIPDMAEAIGVPPYTASAVIRALRHIKPLPGQGAIYGRNKGVHCKMKRGE